MRERKGGEGEKGEGRALAFESAPTFITVAPPMHRV